MSVRLYLHHTSKWHANDEITVVVCDVCMGLIVDTDYIRHLEWHKNELHARWDGTFPPDFDYNGERDSREG